MNDGFWKADGAIGYLKPHFALPSIVSAPSLQNQYGKGNEILTSCIYLYC